MEGGSSNTRVSRSSNSNSFPHSGTPQVALNFPCLAPDLISRSTTIQVPHFGQVTQEHRMRSAMVKIIGALPPLPTIVVCLIDPSILLRSTRGRTTYRILSAVVTNPFRVVLL